MTERIPLYLNSSGIAAEIPIGDTVAANRIDLTDYLKLSGRVGGQVVKGGTGSTDSLTLQSTNHANKGKIFLGSLSVYDEANDRLGLGLTNPSNQLELTKSIQLVGTINNTTGIIFKGSQSFLHNFCLAGTTPDSNTFCGLDAGNFTMTGSAGGQGVHLSGFGCSALNSNTTGAGNSAFGDNSLYSNTQGNYNTSVGFGNLLSNTTGTHNSGLGRSALSNNQTGSYHTAIGGLALSDCNTAVGTGANTAIGYNTGLGITTGINNTIIGANVTGLSSTLTGNIILSDGAGTIKYRYDGTNTTLTGPVIATTKLSVGTAATPLYGLDVADTLVPTSGTSRSFFLQTTINPVSNSTANLYAQQISLSVLGTVDKTGVLRVANFTGSVDAACNVTTLQGFNSLVQIASISGNSKVATNLIGANLGIANLANSYIVTNGIGLKVQSPSNTGTGSITNTCGVMIDNHSVGTNDCHLLIGTSTIPSGTFGIYVSTNNNNYFSGNVGINEVSPDYKLDVNGTLGFTPGSSVIPIDNGDVVIEATNNTTLTLKLKGSDGTVRTGTVILA